MNTVKLSPRNNARTDLGLAAACGIPADHLVEPCEPVVMNASGSQSHDRVQITMSVEEFALLVDAINTAPGINATRPGGGQWWHIVLRSLRDQLSSLLGAILLEGASHTGAHAPALRLSHRDGFHSSDQQVGA